MKILLFILFTFNLYALDFNQSINLNTTDIITLKKEIEVLKKENTLLQLNLERIDWKRDSDISNINNRVESLGNYIESNGILVSVIIGLFSALMTVLVIFLTLKSNKEAKLVAKDEAENEIEKWIEKEAKTHIESTKRELNEYIKHVKKGSEEIESLLEESKYKILIEDDDMEISIENREMLDLEVKAIKRKSLIERTFQDNLKIIYHYITSKHYHKAEKRIDSLILKYTSDFELSRLYYLRAIIADKQTNEEEAIKYYEASISKSQKYSDPYRDLGFLYTMVKKDYKKAMPLFKKAIEVNPQDYKAHVRFGVTLRLNNNIDKSIILYEKAIEINPDASLAYNSLGILYNLEQNNSLKAIEFFRKAIEVDSDLSTVAYAYSNILRIELLDNNYLDKKFENEFIQKFKNKDLEAFAYYELYKILFKMVNNKEVEKDIIRWKKEHENKKFRYIMITYLIKWGENIKDKKISKEIIYFLKSLDKFYLEKSLSE